MNEEAVREILDNMSEQELNDFIFFALKEVKKETQKLIEYYLNIIETDGINAFCKNVRRKGYVYADYIGETIN